VIWKKKSIDDDLDEIQATIRHRKLLLSKPYLKKLYTEWYRGFAEIAGTMDGGKFLEIGSGGGFLKDVLPSVITSDLQAIPDLDMVFAAEEMPFGPGELDGIFMLNTLHHIPISERFFAKANVALRTGGIIYMVEPANTLLSRWIYQNFHHEPFEPQGKWKFSSSGPLSGANGALSWILFNRDLDEFRQKFPQLKPIKLKLHTPFRYILSGGLSHKSLLPGWAFGLSTALEQITLPLYPNIAMFQTVVLRKVEPSRVIKP